MRTLKDIFIDRDRLDKKYPTDLDKADPEYGKQVDKLNAEYLKLTKNK